MKNAILGLITIAVLSGCGGSDDKSVGERIDEGIAKVDHAIDKYTDKDDKPQQGDVDPVNTNADYPIYWGATLFPHSSEVNLMYNIKVHTSYPLQYIYFSNLLPENHSGSGRSRTLLWEGWKNNNNLSNLKNDEYHLLQFSPDGEEALIREVISNTISQIASCLYYDHENKITNKTITCTSIALNSDTTLTTMLNYSGIKVKSINNETSGLPLGKVVEYAMFDVDTMINISNSETLNIKFEMGLHQGLGIGFLKLSDDKNRFYIVDSTFSYGHSNFVSYGLGYGNNVTLEKIDFDFNISSDYLM